MGGYVLEDGTKIATDAEYIDLLEQRIAHLDAELRRTQKSVYGKRKEIRNQRRWIDRWKEENPKAALRVKELENLRGKLARVRFNGEQAQARLDAALLFAPGAENALAVFDQIGDYEAPIEYLRQILAALPGQEEQ